MTETGGVGVFNPTTGISTMLPAPGGTTLQRATGITVDSEENILVTEREKRRVLSVHPTTGAIEIYVE